MHINTCTDSLPSTPEATETLDIIFRGYKSTCPDGSKVINVMGFIKKDLPDETKANHFCIALDMSGSMKAIVGQRNNSTTLQEVRVTPDERSVAVAIEQRSLNTRANIVRLGILSCLYSRLVQDNESSGNDTTFRILCYNTSVVYDTGVLRLTDENLRSITQSLMGVMPTNGTCVSTALEKFATDRQDFIGKKGILMVLTDGEDQSGYKAFTGYSRKQYRDDLIQRILDRLSFGEKEGDESLDISIGFIGIGTPNRDFRTDFVKKFTSLRSVKSGEPLYGKDVPNMTVACTSAYAKLNSHIPDIGKVDLEKRDGDTFIISHFYPNDDTSCLLGKTSHDDLILKLQNRKTITLDLTSEMFVEVPNVHKYYTIATELESKTSKMRNELHEYNNKMSSARKQMIRLNESRSYLEANVSDACLMFCYHNMGISDPDDSGDSLSPEFIREKIKLECERMDELSKQLFTDASTLGKGVFLKAIIKQPRLPTIEETIPEPFRNTSLVKRLFGVCQGMHSDYDLLLATIVSDRSRRQQVFQELPETSADIYMIQTTSSDGAYLTPCAMTSPIPGLSELCTFGGQEEIGNDYATCICCCAEFSNVVNVPCMHSYLCHACHLKVSADNGDTCIACKKNVTCTVDIDKKHLCENLKCPSCLNKVKEFNDEDKNQNEKVAKRQKTVGIQKHHNPEPDILENTLHFNHETLLSSRLKQRPRAMRAIMMLDKCNHLVSCARCAEELKTDNKMYKCNVDGCNAVGNIHRVFVT